MYILQSKDGTDPTLVRGNTRRNSAGPGMEECYRLKLHHNL